jgi:hypothetical protein
VSRKQSKWDNRHIVAWDGEGVNVELEDGTVRQLYVLLANSNKQRLVNTEGISSVTALDFLCDYAKASDINVIFGGSYDANMILADLPRAAIARLWAEGQTSYREFYVRYIWRKCLIVKRRGVDTKWEAGITLWDVLGFFQKSFVKVVQEWLPEEDVGWLAEMKAERGTFRMEEIPQIVKYTDLENQLLVRVCGKLFGSLEDAQIRLNRFDGAGAIAGFFLRKNNVDAFLGDQPKAVTLAAQHAYAGGRIEAPKIGNLPYGKVYRYDINSAYPSVMQGLPCLAHGHWEHEGVSPFMLCHVRWEFEEGQPFYPLFYRTHDSRILLPREGEGWYWLPEVDGLENIDLLETWAWMGDCDHRPFGFIPQVYGERLRFQDEGNKAEVGLKLGYNSLYGKMVQQAGWKMTGERPRYHNLCMGGYTTAGCRAKMYRTAMQHPDSVIGFATDAVIGTEPFDVPIGRELGEWTADQFDGITVAQPGVYWLRRLEQEVPSKFRGFDPGALRREFIIGAWMSDQEKYEAEVERFIGVGSALMGEDQWNRWRTWQKSKRVLDIMPTGKRMATSGVPIHEYSWSLVPTIPSPNLTPNVISAKYPLEWDEDNPPNKNVAGVPFDVIESEWFDSYA